VDARIITEKFSHVEVVLDGVEPHPGKGGAPAEYIVGLVHVPEKGEVKRHGFYLEGSAIKEEA